MGTLVQDRLVSIHAAAERLGVSMATVRRYIRRGDLPATKLNGGHFRISEVDIEALIERGRYRPRRSAQR
jgi:excisionase family DNA binding protein